MQSQKGLQLNDEPGSSEEEIISKIFQQKCVADLILAQLQQLPKKSYEVYAAYDRLYILIRIQSHVHKNEGKTPQIPLKENSHKQHHFQAKFWLRITKGFPIAPVRMYLTDGYFQPKLFDTRDLLQQTLNQPYSHAVKLINVFESLPKLLQKLHSRSQKYLEMQKTGVIHLGDTFFYQQLHQFTSLVTFRQKSQKKLRLIGVSETHFFIFRELKEKEKSTKLSKKMSKNHHSQSLLEPNGKTTKKLEQDLIFKKLILVNVCDLQCINTLCYFKENKEFQITFKKYKSIKLYYEPQTIVKTFKISQPQGFLRCLLKYIGKFQPTQILFNPQQKGTKLGNPQDQEQVKLVQKITQCNKLEEDLLNCDESTQGMQKKTKSLDQINKIYQKLIEYYSARANPYYLIYVNKLNGLYMKYFLNSKKQSA